MNKKNKLFYCAFGVDGKKYELNEEQAKKLVQGKERFVFVALHETWLTQDAIIKIERLD